MYGHLRFPFRCYFHFHCVYLFLFRVLPIYTLLLSLDYLCFRCLLVYLFFLSRVRLWFCFRFPASIVLLSCRRGRYYFRIRGAIHNSFVRSLSFLHLTLASPPHHRYLSPRPRAFGRPLARCAYCTTLYLYSVRGHDTTPRSCLLDSTRLIPELNPHLQTNTLTYKHSQTHSLSNTHTRPRTLAHTRTRPRRLE